MEPGSNNRNSQDKNTANGPTFIDMLLCKLEGTYLLDVYVVQARLSQVYQGGSIFYPRPKNCPQVEPIPQLLLPVC